MKPIIIEKNKSFQKILIVFSVVGGILSIVELLGVVLSCCMASQHAQAEREAEDWEYDYGNGFGRPDSPGTGRKQQQRDQPRARATIYFYKDAKIEDLLLASCSF